VLKIRYLILTACRKTRSQAVQKGPDARRARNRRAQAYLL